MGKEHKYKTTVKWTGNKGRGTTGYRDYGREHTISVENKPDITGSSDPSFRGDSSKYNPEDLLLSSLSACHMLWYLHLCAEAGVVVTDYKDQASGIMKVLENGKGKFTEVTLNPVVTVQKASMIDQAKQIHQQAGKFCFIANSVDFPVIHHSTIKSVE